MVTALCIVDGLPVRRTDTSRRHRARIHLPFDVDFDTNDVDPTFLTVARFESKREKERGFVPLVPHMVIDPSAAADVSRVLHQDGRFAPEPLPVEENHHHEHEHHDHEHHDHELLQPVSEDDFGNGVFTPETASVVPHFEVDLNPQVLIVYQDPVTNAVQVPSAPQETPDFTLNHHIHIVINDQDKVFSTEHVHDVTTAAGDAIQTQSLPHEESHVEVDHEGEEEIGNQDDTVTPQEESPVINEADSLNSIEDSNLEILVRDKVTTDDVLSADKVVSSHESEEETITTDAPLERTPDVMILIPDNDHILADTAPQHSLVQDEDHTTEVDHFTTEAVTIIRHLDSNEVSMDTTESTTTDQSEVSSSESEESKETQEINTESTTTDQPKESSSESEESNENQAITQSEEAQGTELVNDQVREQRIFKQTARFYRSHLSGRYHWAHSYGINWHDDWWARNTLFGRQRFNNSRTGY